ncbi:MAG: adenosylcobinamide-GDP ribazoletransferase [Clostridiaceae bacterium]|nr:adenosylcobinamide-GDP ribazoletransferase [Clostridiaceae bacterium]
MKNFILMLQFFTRIPININIDVKEENFQRGIIYFPFIGLVIGGINAIAYYLFSLIFSNLVAIIFLTFVNVLITGALHLDGIADTCDGIFSARKKEKMLEIMKDSRLGTNGAIAIFFDLSLRIAMITSIPKDYIVIAVLVSNIISRTMLVFLCYISKYARLEGGLGNLFIGKVSKSNFIIALTFGSIISILLFDYMGLLLIIVASLFIVMFNRYISSKIDGITGDVLGAANELVEILVLVAFVILGRYGLI